jgi:hypothetical protein
MFEINMSQRVETVVKEKRLKEDNGRLTSRLGKTDTQGRKTPVSL